VKGSLAFSNFTIRTYWYFKCSMEVQEDNKDVEEEFVTKQLWQRLRMNKKNVAAFWWTWPNNVK